MQDASPRPVSPTGLLNRLSLSTDINRQQRTSERCGRYSCVALCDVEFFKRYNDTYGHPAGDPALRRVSATLLDQLRDVDLVYRYGGRSSSACYPNIRWPERRSAWSGCAPAWLPPPSSTPVRRPAC